MKSFPKPLNDKEESEIITLCQDGDSEARNILIERNLRLVVHIVKRYVASERELDDLISIGTIGLIKAVDSYKPGKNIRLATYASKCIDNELLMFFRNTKKYSKEIYLQEPIGCDKEGNEISLMDILETVEDDFSEAVELKDNIRKLYGYIREIPDKRERSIIIMRYGLFRQKERTQREIADILGISRSYVSRLEKKMLNTLYQKMISGM